MSRIRVCHLSSVHRPFDTRVFHKQCRTLAAAGYDVTLVVRHERDETIDGVRIRALPTPRDRFRRMTATVGAVRAAAIDEDADIYHFHDPELMPVGVELERRGKPVIYDAHENYSAQIARKPWLPRYLRGGVATAASFMERRLAGRLSAVVAAGRDIEAALAGHAKRLVRVDNFPILDERLLAGGGERSPGFVLANFGGVWDARVTGGVVEALGLLPEESPVRMILGGRVVQPELHERIQALPGWSRVEFKGLVDQDVLLNDNLASHVAVNLYSDSPNHHSIRSNRVYEGMAAGLPVLVSHFPEWRTFVERHQCGLAVDPDDPRDIAAAVERLAADPDAAAAMGANGRRAVLESYNWTCGAETLLALYAELVGPPERDAS